MLTGGSRRLPEPNQRLEFRKKRKKDNKDKEDNKREAREARAADPPPPPRSPPLLQQKPPRPTTAAATVTASASGSTGSGCCSCDCNCSCILPHCSSDTPQQPLPRGLQQPRRFPGQTTSVLTLFCTSCTCSFTLTRLRRDCGGETHRRQKQRRLPRVVVVRPVATSAATRLPHSPSTPIGVEEPPPTDYEEGGSSKAHSIIEGNGLLRQPQQGLRLGRGRVRAHIGHYRRTTGMVRAEGLSMWGTCCLLSHH